MKNRDLFSLFSDLQRLGWLRPLDRGFAEFLHELEPDAPEVVMLLGGLVSHVLARGQVYLDLRALLEGPAEVLGLPPAEPPSGWDAALEPGLAEAVTAGLNEALAALELDELLAVLRASRLIAQGMGGQGGEPLVLEGERLFLRRNWQAIRQIQADLNLRAGVWETSQDATELRVLFDALFADADPLEGVDWQRVACAAALRHGFAVITGGPGTGKTWTMGKLIALLQAVHARQNQNNEDRGENLEKAGTNLPSQPLRILLAAPTGKAAARMDEALRHSLEQLPPEFRRPEWQPEAARTIHRLLGSRPGSVHFRHNAGNPLLADVVMIDEASMVDLGLMRALVDALAPDTRLVLLGDRDQLDSVEPGAVFADLCIDAADLRFSDELVDWVGQVTGQPLEAGAAPAFPWPCVMLRTARRFNADIAALATAVNAGQVETALALLDGNSPHLDRLASGHPGDRQLRQLLIEAGFQDYFEQLQAGAEIAAEDEAGLEHWLRDCLKARERFQVLTAVRRGDWGVEALNERIRRWLAAAGQISEAAGVWFAGRPVIMTRNDYGTGLMNGDMGLCVALPQTDGSTALRVVFILADGRLASFSPARLGACETAWAITVHKSQGSEFERVVLVLPERDSPVLGRELVYTGLTRARNHLTVVAPEEALLIRAIRDRAERSVVLAPGLTNSV